MGWYCGGDCGTILKSKEISVTFVTKRNQKSLLVEKSVDSVGEKIVRNKV